MCQKITESSSLFLCYHIASYIRSLSVGVFVFERLYRSTVWQPVMSGNAPAFGV